LHCRKHDEPDIGTSALGTLLSHGRRPRPAATAAYAQFATMSIWSGGISVSAYVD